ncbi:MAG: 16S rRNA (cytosine(967)-C(5))-methyltransferase RsmB [Candidatus Hydrogenedentes bacterium]|nr:16S rRNA (cytosine(967)-C(5))-methyltransferase RsmB [Candidatus Hydrogenedentota bacterium]
MPADPVRDAAIQVLLRVFEQDAYINRALDRALRRKTNLSRRGTRFMTQLVYGTARHKGLCDFVLDSRTHQPLEKLPAPIRCILRMGVFQALFCDQVTFPAMVHTSVDLAKKRGHAGTARLVNAVLNRAPKALDEIAFPDPESQPVEYLSTRYSLPAWLVEKWRANFGAETADSICEASDTEAPRTLRVNTTLTTREGLLGTLKKSGVTAVAASAAPEAIHVLDGPLPTGAKAFQRGLYYMQDEASMLAGHLLAPEPGDRILDMCSAPGGKTTHLAQLAKGRARIVAMDEHAWKLGLVLENSERLQLKGISPLTADGGSPPFDGKFDRILLDAPCSGFGTLRRHPELKWRATPGLTQEMAAIQQRLLRSAVRLCKNGGLIVYSVCTFTPEETFGIAEEMVNERGVACEDGPEWLYQWKIGTGQYRILPRKGQSDGYFLTALRKQS